MDFKEYVRGVLPSEWVATWEPNSLRAGAMAVKMFAWWRILHPRSSTYDILDNTWDQVYRSNYTHPNTDAAIELTWSYSMTNNGTVLEIHYVDTDAHCQEWLSGTLCMGQWNSQYLAQQGRDWQWILQNYYGPVDITLQQANTGLTTARSFDFSSSLHGWYAANDILDLQVYQRDNGGMWGAIRDTDNANGIDPYIIGPMMVPFRATDYTHMRIVMDREMEGEAPCAQIYWRKPGQGNPGDFNSTQRINFVPVANSVTTTYEIDLTQNSYWSGTIEQLRFDPSCRHTVANGTSYFRIDKIELYNANVTSGNPRSLRWAFNLAVPQGWTAARNLEGLKQLDGGMWANATGANPAFGGPVMQTFNAADFTTLQFKMSTRLDHCVELFWRAPGEGFSTSKKLQIPIERNGSYSVDLSNVANWAGPIEQLLFEPSCVWNPTPNDTAVRLDYLQLIGQDPVVQPPAEIFEIAISPEAVTIGIGETTSFNIQVLNPDMAPDGGIRGLDLACNVTQPLVTGVEVIHGAAFGPDAVSVLLPSPDFAPLPAFQWLTSLREDAASITEDGTAVTVSYVGAVEGTTQLTCTADAISATGALIEDVPVTGATIEVVGNGTITGIVTLEEATNHAGIVVILTDENGTPVTTATTAADGAFSFTVEPGSYFVRADADGYVTVASEPIVVVGGTTENMGTAVLAAGDVNADDVVDLLDITDFAARYNDAVTNATDFDRSGAHDLLDFTALVDNLDLVGPTNWTN
ncbi:MAG: carboxypeptidase regulatory-like domain-containing protein [Anaerolineae bacterium]|nr:carboxypeptidase regulatory-like domain-containing protein [Anaerolineae bacterium]